eukprot:TRINITY_DN5124_c0_g1_i4.p1 TRINITY_DN5124_c0_g1~~TRINITY_DN5124_c0_g1_i4.p1  ORF type:complete len:158 (-),score=45.56 TRINITY_DN5124_c0_g1_i4:106-537(-)
MSNRDALFGGDGGGGGGSTGGGGSKRRAWGVPEETEETRGLDNQQLFSTQQKIVQQQDDQLDLLSHSIGRSKQVALAIDDEVTEQDALLQGLDAHVDRTGAKLRNTTRRVARTEKKASTKCLWLLICLLCLGLIGVTVAAFET